MSSISILSFIVLTLTIGYTFIYPAFGDLNQLSDQKQKYVDSLDMVSNVETKKKELLEKLNKIPPDERKNIETILPSSLNFVRLISQIDAVAAKYGISIKQVSSKEVSSSVGASIEDAEPSRTYSSSIIGFSFEASYDNFNAFLDDLEKSLRVLDIRLVRLESQKNDVYFFNLEFETYWLK